MDTAQDPKNSDGWVSGENHLGVSSQPTPALNEIEAPCPNEVQHDAAPP